MSATDPAAAGRNPPENGGSAATKNPAFSRAPEHGRDPPTFRPFFASGGHPLPVGQLFIVSGAGSRPSFSAQAMIPSTVAAASIIPPAEATSRPASISPGTYNRSTSLPRLDSWTCRMIASVRSLNRRTSSRPATTAGASRAELTITPQPAPAPSPQPRPGPTGRALLLKPAAQGGQSWTPIDTSCVDVPLPPELPPNSVAQRRRSNSRRPPRHATQSRCPANPANSSALSPISSATATNSGVDGLLGERFHLGPQLLFRLGLGMFDVRVAEVTSYAAHGRTPFIPAHLFLDHGGAPFMLDGCYERPLLILSRSAAVSLTCRRLLCSFERGT